MTALPLGIWEFGIAGLYLGALILSYAAFMDAFPKMRVLLMTSPYRDEVLGTAPRIAVEAAVAQGWHEWLRPGDRFVGLSDFGVSAPGPKVFEHFGLTAVKVADAARAIVKG